MSRQKELASSFILSFLYLPKRGFKFATENQIFSKLEGYLRTSEYNSDNILILIAIKEEVHLSRKIKSEGKTNHRKHNPPFNKWLANVLIYLSTNQNSNIAKS